jgi:hypothetical protein
MATEEDPPAAIKPAPGLLQLGWFSYFWSHPLGQRVHDVEAFSCAYLPGLQGKQLTDPDVDAYFPAGHASRSEALPSHL